MYTGEVIEQEVGAVSKIYKDGVLIEEREHLNESRAICYMRYAKVVNSQRFETCIFIGLDGKVTSLMLE